MKSEGACGIAFEGALVTTHIWVKKTLMKSPDFILAGYERGGTTLLSEIFRSNGYESGFECGVLMGETPKDLRKAKPYWDMLLPGWKISPKQRRHATSGDFEQFYDRLYQAAFPEFSGRFFDKTPIYMSQLGLCMKRAPNLKGALVIHRDPRAVFLSNARRTHPKLSAEEAVSKELDTLAKRYIRYFIGCIAHLDNPDVLFVPFEDLVSREDTWLQAIGNFAGGCPFVGMQGNPRFGNVTSSKMDLAKVMEFDETLSPDLQNRIMEATKLASLFFADATDRAKFGQFWHDIKGEADQVISRHGLPRALELDDGTYFEPLTYLLRYEDVRKAGVNPVTHFQNHGRSEKRAPY